MSNEIADPPIVVRVDRDEALLCVRHYLPVTLAAAENELADLGYTVTWPDTWPALATVTERPKPTPLPDLAIYAYPSEGREWAVAGWSFGWDYWGHHHRPPRDGFTVHIWADADGNDHAEVIRP